MAVGAKRLHVAQVARQFRVDRLWLDVVNAGDLLVSQAAYLARVIVSLQNQPLPVSSFASFPVCRLLVRFIWKVQAMVIADCYHPLVLFGFGRVFFAIRRPLETASDLGFADTILVLIRISVASLSSTAFCRLLCVETMPVTHWVMPVDEP
jgi:hypothetical protein